MWCDCTNYNTRQHVGGFGCDALFEFGFQLDLNHTSAKFCDGVKLKSQSKIILQLFHKLTLASLSIWKVFSSRYLGELAAVSEFKSFVSLCWLRVQDVNLYSKSSALWEL